MSAIHVAPLGVRRSFPRLLGVCLLCPHLDQSSEGPVRHAVTDRQYAWGDRSTKAWPPCLNGLTPKGHPIPELSAGLGEDYYCNGIGAELPPLFSPASRTPYRSTSQSTCCTQISVLPSLFSDDLKCNRVFLFFAFNKFSFWTVVIRTPLRKGGVFWGKEPCWVSWGFGVTCGNGVSRERRGRGLQEARGELLALLLNREEASERRDEWEGQAEDTQRSQSGGQKPAQVRKAKDFGEGWQLCGSDVNLSGLPSEIIRKLCYTNRSSGKVVCLVEVKEGAKFQPWDTLGHRSYIGGHRCPWQRGGMWVEPWVPRRLGTQLKCRAQRHPGHSLLLQAGVTSGKSCQCRSAGLRGTGKGKVLGWPKNLFGFFRKLFLANSILFSATSLPLEPRTRRPRCSK